MLKWPATPQFSVVLPGPPPAHTLQASRGVFVKNGRVRFFTKQAARRDAERMVRAFRTVLPSGWRPLEGPCRAEFVFAFGLRQDDHAAENDLLPHTSRPDCDNIAKSVSDSLTRAQVWQDDSLVVDWHLVKGRAVHPRLEVRVWEAIQPSQLTLF